MKSRALALIVLLVILSSSVPAGASEFENMPYVYTPTVPETSFAVLALYKVGDYGRVLEGCEWLLQLKTPFDSWGRVYGAEHEAKFTGLALMALIRGESVARGRYFDTINGAAYWLIFKQNSDGSWEDYLGTAVAVTALQEFLDSKYVDPKLPKFKDQVKKAVERGRAWLSSHQPKSDEEIAFASMALHDGGLLKTAEPGPFKYFALAYLGKDPSVPGNIAVRNPLEAALLLYATGDEKYHDALVRMEHFGFWGTLRYNPVDLMEASKVWGFESLKSIACPYVSKIQPQLHFEWEKVVYASYFLSCGMDVELPNSSTYSSLKPWQIAEIARIKSKTGAPYDGEVSYLLSHINGTSWGDFYNTEYVVWVLRSLNVSVDYAPILRYLESSIANDSPTYYYAYALMVFKEFGREAALNETLYILGERQGPDGGWGYTAGAPSGIKSTATVLWALERAGLVNTPLYTRGWNFLRKAIYAEIPAPKERDGEFRMENATIVQIKNGRYIGNATGAVSTVGLDGLVYIYPSKNPLVIGAVAEGGFHAESPWMGRGRQYVAIAGLIAGLLGAFYAVILLENRRRR
ncbi:squalene cyclase [Thermococcus profundus]|uniref:Squalene cyclase n=1 Tax=Thermococcus profundus TaxID=49899 RepID=A0A2Z2M691_THEPR|nr:squalene cyclase [Thermococcus profundus]ASJ01820.1 squalene cyclase [Thermococcus profundus]